MMLTGKKILLGVSGSIAAYKSAQLVRLLVKAGAEVKVIMTPSAKDFITPLALSTLSKNPVLHNLFDEHSWHNHALLGRWADLMVIAPLSCNTLSKMVHGNCDNLLLAVYLSATCPVVVAPAMDEDMWHHPSTRHNLTTLESFGNKIIPIENGELASGLIGEGRMAEPEQILAFIQSNFFFNSPLKNKKVIVTAGPTIEPIDPVRYISNHSSGKMGIALAKDLQSRGANVTLILGPVHLDFNYFGMNVINVSSAAEMFQEVHNHFKNCDLAIMAAAVADYTPVTVSSKKIKKKEPGMSLELVKTKDILKSLGEVKRKDQILIGFALETDSEEVHAKEKLEKKNTDMIVLNSMKDEGAGFGHNTNKITIFSRDNEVIRFETKTKSAVAKDIIDTIIKLYYA